CREVGTRRADDVVEPDSDPRPAEDPVDLERVMIGIGIPRTRQGASSLDRYSGACPELVVEKHGPILLTHESVCKRRALSPRCARAVQCCVSSGAVTAHSQTPKRRDARGSRP